MTLVGVNVRRTLQLLLAVVLLFGATSVIASQSAEAAFPGGNGWIVFDDGAGDLWAMPSDGSAAPTNITADADAAAGPVFSPDGTKVAFAKSVAGDSQIWVATFNAAGPSLSGLTQITTGTVDGEPTWSPDGAWIAFHRRVPAAITSGTATATGADLVDTGNNFVTAGVVAGDRVTNTTTGESGTVASLTGTDTVVLTAPLPSGFTATNAYTIERRNRQVFKTQSTGLDLNLTRLSAAGSELLYNDQDPAWAPVGDLIAFTTTRNGNADIYTMGTDGSSPTNLTSDVAFDNNANSPAWSPDGTRVAFQSAEPNVAHSNIWTITPAASGAVQVTGNFSGGNGDTLEENDYAPAWSPDGTKIAFRRDGAVGLGLTWTVPVDATGAATGAVSIVNSSTAAAIHSGPNWQPVLTAVADAAAVNEGGTVDINVLTNDLTLLSSVGTPGTSATLAALPTKGTATMTANGVFRYVHNGSEVLATTTDTFQYTLNQGSLSATGTVTVTINPVDDPPVAVNDEYFVSHAGTLTVAAVDGVLDNDTDVDSGSLSAAKVTDPTHGSLTFNANGSFTYTHDGVSTSALVDSFTYKANDGNSDSNVATVTINVAAENALPPTVEVSGPAFGAPGVEASFSATVTDGAGPRVYAWTATAGGATVASGTDAAFAFTPATAGAYTVELSVSDDAGIGTDSVTFTVMSDIASSVFVNDIVWLANEGITKGCNPPTNDQYCPTNNVTRGQMAAFLVRFLGLTDIDPAISFTDTTGSIFEQDILKLATAGITKGCNAAGDEYCPNDPVTRGQMAAFLVRALGLTDVDPAISFTDTAGSIFEQNILRLATAGITKGCNPPANDQFCPDGNVTRGQMAAFLHRADSFR